jgi:hypothetical protein
VILIMEWTRIIWRADSLVKSLYLLVNIPDALLESETALSISIKTITVDRIGRTIL